MIFEAVRMYNSSGLVVTPFPSNPVICSGARIAIWFEAESQTLMFWLPQTVSVVTM